MLLATPRSIEKDTKANDLNIKDMNVPQSLTDIVSSLESLLSNHEVIVDKELQNDVSQAFADKKDDTSVLYFDEKQYIVVRDNNGKVIQGKRARLDNTSPTH